MNIQTQRFIDRWAGQLLCSAVSGWVKFTGLFGAQARMPGHPKNILVILLSEMGSIVLAGPMFAALRRQYPGVAIHILQLKKNQEVSKLLSLTEVEHMHTLDDSSGGALIRDILRVSLVMRKLGLDAVIDCELFSRVSALLSFSTGAPVRVGFHAAHARRLVPRQLHQPQHSLQPLPTHQQAVFVLGGRLAVT